MISDETFEYKPASNMIWGGFNWKFDFKWYPIPQRELKRISGDQSVPVRFELKNVLLRGTKIINAWNRFKYESIIFLNHCHFPLTVANYDEFTQHDWNFQNLNPLDLSNTDFFHVFNIFSN